MLQLELAGIEGRQLSVSVQPFEIARLLMLMAAAAGFVTITPCGVPEVPRSWLPKLRLVGVTVRATVTSPVPVN